MTRTRKASARPDRTCYHCAAPIRGGGPRTDDGVYFCSKGECQAAKKRDAYRRATAIDTRPDAAQFCHKCAKPLKPRKVRHNENPRMRWCDAPACRRARVATLTSPEVAAPDPAELEDLKTRVKFLTFAISEPRLECGLCGLRDAVPGFQHIDGTLKARCYGVGSEEVPKGLGSVVWPIYPAALTWENNQPEDVKLPRRHDAPGGTYEVTSATLEPSPD